MDDNIMPLYRWRTLRDIGYGASPFRVIPESRQKISVERRRLVEPCLNADVLKYIQSQLEKRGLVEEKHAFKTRTVRGYSNDAVSLVITAQLGPEPPAVSQLTLDIIARAIYLHGAFFSLKQDLARTKTDFMVEVEVPELRTDDDELRILGSRRTDFELRRLRVVLFDIIQRHVGEAALIEARTAMLYPPHSGTTLPRKPTVAVTICDDAPYNYDMLNLLCERRISELGEGQDIQVRFIPGRPLP